MLNRRFPEVIYVVRGLGYRFEGGFYLVSWKFSVVFTLIAAGPKSRLLQ